MPFSTGKHNSVATELRTEQPSAGAQKACRRTEPARASASRASLALAALRLAHEHACADRARHAHCTRASLASDARALTRQHALKRTLQEWRARVTGHWQRVGRRAACASGSHTRCKCTSHFRCSCGARVAHTLYMPCTTTVVTCVLR